MVFTRHGPLLADGSDMIARRRRRDAIAHDTGTRRRCGIAARSSTRWSHRWRRYGGAGDRQEHVQRVQLDRLRVLLRNLEVETLVLAGMATDMCVETTARDAADRGSM